MTKFLPLLLLVISVTAQAQNFEQRRDQYIDSVMANSAQEAIIIQAYLGQTVNQQALDDIYDSFDTRPTIDFALVELIRVMFLGNGAYDNQMLPHLETLPYWLNDGDTLHTYWTENHMIMWMSCEWLLHERHGWTVDANLKQRLLHYLNLKLEVGFYEFFSSTYYPYTLSGLLNLADFAEDQEIKEKSELVAKKLLAQMLLMTNEDGVYYPAAGRNYISKYEQPYTETYNAVIYLASGLGPCPSVSASRADFIATTSVDLSSIESTWTSTLDTIFSIGNTPEDAMVKHDSLADVDEMMLIWSGGMYFHPYLAERTGYLLADSNLWGHVDFTDFALLSTFPPSNFEAVAYDFDELSTGGVICGADVAIYKNEATVLTSLQDFSKGKIGFQQWPVAANVGGTAVFPASGPVEPIWEDRTGNNFNEHLPYVEQSHNVVLVMYRPQSVSPVLPYSNKDVALYLKDQDFDEINEDGNWLLGRKDESYVAVRRACVGEINGVRACETNVGQTWVIIVGNDAMYGNFQVFENLVSQSTYNEEWLPDMYGDSAYYASIGFDTISIDYTWGPENPLSITPLEEDEWQVYPNPTRDYLHVPIPANTTVEVSLISSEGKVVFQSSANSKFSIDMKPFAGGIYFLRLTDGVKAWNTRIVKLN